MKKYIALLLALALALSASFVSAFAEEGSEEADYSEYDFLSTASDAKVNVAVGGESVRVFLPGFDMSKSNTRWSINVLLKKVGEGQYVVVSVAKGTGEGAADEPPEGHVLLAVHSSSSHLEDLATYQNVEGKLAAAYLVEGDRIVLEFDDENVTKAARVKEFPATDTLLGDFDGDNAVTSDDAVYLLRHTLFSEYYPLSGFADFDHDGGITSDDAVYLLRHTLFSEYYPLSDGSVSGEKYSDGVIGANTGSSGHSDYKSEYGYDDYMPEYGEADCIAEEPCVEPGSDYIDRCDGEDDGWYGPVYNGQENYSAGTLTAGEWRDIDALGEWISQFDDSEWQQYAKKRGLYAFNVFEVRVTDGDNDVYNAKVELYAADGETLIYSAVTDITGRAYLVYPEKYAEDLGVIRSCGKEINVSAQDNGKSFDIKADKAGAELKKLDLMLMVDTTGSMGDELEYLKAELLDMVSRVAANDEALSIRVSVNFYRDEGDDYIVKYFDFRTDINECLAQIRAQHAYGGGDYPEAVHTALENAVNGHAWREDAVKLCFMVLDAPPHEEYEIQGINAQIANTLTDAAALGVRIIPVASSGVDKDTECLLRSYAVMTGGTYIFLTDHSGIGNGHIEASVGEYDVEPLNECMIRVVCEYCGLEYTAPESPDEQ